MKQLVTSFNSDGFAFKQIAREGNVAVFEKWQGSFHTWEAIKVRQKSVPSPNGGRQMYEAYPRSEEWGEWGWALPTKERAYQKMDELLGKK